VSQLAGERGIRDTVQWFTREKQWVNDMHLQLCRVPAPTFLEQERAEWMASAFRSLGWDAGIDRAGNVLASLDPAPSGRLVAITAHLDTVLAPRLRDDVHIDDTGAFRGPGVSDNGAGLAGLLAIARAIQVCGNPEGLWDRLVLVANTCEEGEGNLRGMRHLCEQSPLAGRVDSYLCLDGAAVDHITAQALGSRRFEVTISGQGGHSWSDFGIGNPVHTLARAMAAFVDQRPVDPRVHPRVSVNVGVIEGGAGVNAIPGSARAKVDIRSESNERIDDLVAQLHAAVVKAEEIENNRALAAKVTAKIREIGSRPAAQLDPEAALLSCLRAVDAHLGIRSRLDCASTDANIPLSLGIPAVSIGAGGLGGGAHTPGEWYRPDGRDLGLKRVLLAAAMLLRAGV
jgi:acetylornithine deacetylase/succinyl-diaminopimelate desuccinylase-like protein